LFTTDRVLTPAAAAAAGGGGGGGGGVCVFRDVCRVLDGVASCQVPIDSYLARGAGGELAKNQQQIDDLAKRMEENNQVGGGVGKG
jgi:hypothetical protein